MAISLKLVDRRQVEIASWDFSPTAGAAGNDEILVTVGETDQLMFSVVGFDPEQHYTIRIGDIWVGDVLPPSGAGIPGIGISYSPGMLNWMQYPYFESGRGRTRIGLFSKLPDASDWGLVSETTVYVLPTKLGEERFDALTDELERLCGGLLLDLLGKSRRSFERSVATVGMSFRSKEQELKTVEKLWETLARLVSRIVRSPATTVKHELRPANYWGDRPMPPSGIRRLALLGVDPRDPCQPRPIRILQRKPVDSSALPEHQILLGFFLLLQKRIVECGESLEAHIQLLEMDRCYRDQQLGGHPSLFRTEDLPRIQLMEEAGVSASLHYSMISKTARLPLFENVVPLFRRPAPYQFEQNSIYRSVKRLINDFLGSSMVWCSDRGKDATLKLTSRAYENWVFMKLVDSFRAIGLELEPWDEFFRNSASKRFTIDFERGLFFSARISGRKWLRINYEPWVHNLEDAARLGATVHRSGRATVPWSPDVLIECIVEDPDNLRTLYAVVVDAKYTASLRDDHWQNTSKYLEIRSVASGRQVVRQLWLAHPGGVSGITCNDPAVTFGEVGVSAPTDEPVQGILSVAPQIADDGTIQDPFYQFAAGTVAYFTQRVSSQQDGR